MLGSAITVDSLSPRPAEPSGPSALGSGSAGPRHEPEIPGSPQGCAKPSTSYAAPSPALRLAAAQEILGDVVMPATTDVAQDWMVAKGPLELVRLSMLNRWAEALAHRSPAERKRRPGDPWITPALLRGERDQVQGKSLHWPLRAGHYGASPRYCLGKELGKAALLTRRLLDEPRHCGDPCQPDTPDPVAPAEYCVAAEGVCPQSDVVTGYILDPHSCWWCDVCWDSTWMSRPADPPGSVAFQVDDLRPAAPYQSLVQFLREAARREVGVRDATDTGGTLMDSMVALMHLGKWLPRPECGGSSM